MAFQTTFKAPIAEITIPFDFLSTANAILKQLFQNEIKLSVVYHLHCTKENVRKIILKNCFRYFAILVGCMSICSFSLRKFVLDLDTKLTSPSKKSYKHENSYLFSDIYWKFNDEVLNKIILQLILNNKQPEKKQIIQPYQT